MCISSSSPKIPEPIKYAAVKTPLEGNVRSSDINDRRRRAASTRTNYTGAGGLTSQPALALKTALGG